MDYVVTDAEGEDTRFASALVDSQNAYLEEQRAILRQIEERNRKESPLERSKMQASCEGTTYACTRSFASNIFPNDSTVEQFHTGTYSRTDTALKKQTGLSFMLGDIISNEDVIQEQLRILEEIQGTPQKSSSDRELAVNEVTNQDGLQAQMGIMKEIQAQAAPTSKPDSKLISITRSAARNFPPRERFEEVERYTENKRVRSTLIQPFNDHQRKVNSSKPNVTTPSRLSGDREPVVGDITDQDVLQAQMRIMQEIQTGAASTIKPDSKLTSITRSAARNFPPLARFKDVERYTENSRVPSTIIRTFSDRRSKIDSSEPKVTTPSRLAARQLLPHVNVAELEPYTENNRRSTTPHIPSRAIRSKDDSSSSSNNSKQLSSYQDQTLQLENGCKVRVKGTRHVYRSIAAGNAKLVMCTACEYISQVDATCQALYCTFCHQVSPVNSSKSVSSDADIARAIQNQEKEMAYRHKT